VNRKCPSWNMIFELSTVSTPYTDPACHIFNVNIGAICLMN